MPLEWNMPSLEAPFNSTLGQLALFGKKSAHAQYEARGIF